MTIKRIQTQYGQNIYDVCMQEYGDLDSLKEFLNLNGLNYNSILQGSQNLLIDATNKGDETVKKFVIENEITYNNSSTVESFSPPLEGGDYNGDYNQDFY